MELCTPLYVSLNMRGINSRASTLIFTQFSGGGFRSNLVGRSDSIWKDRENEPIFPPVERSSGELFPVSSGGERDGTERLSAGRPWIGGVAPSVTGLWPTALALRSCARITVPLPPFSLTLPLSPRVFPSRFERLLGSFCRRKCRKCEGSFEGSREG